MPAGVAVLAALAIGWPTAFRPPPPPRRDRMPPPPSPPPLLMSGNTSATASLVVELGSSGLVLVQSFDEQMRVSVSGALFLPEASSKNVWLSVTDANCAEPLDTSAAVAVAVDAHGVAIFGEEIAHTHEGGRQHLNGTSLGIFVRQDGHDRVLRCSAMTAHRHLLATVIGRCVSRRAHTPSECNPHAHSHLAVQWRLPPSFVSRCTAQAPSVRGTFGGAWPHDYHTPQLPQW